MFLFNVESAAKLTLPLSGRHEARGGEAEGRRSPVHSKGLFEDSIILQHYLEVYGQPAHVLLQLPHLCRHSRRMTW